MRPTTVFEIYPSSERLEFEAFPRSLLPRVGGRAPYYSYLWDFGDGHFSFQKQPTHQYKKAGNYEARLYLVNNYDDGPRPPRGIKKIYITQNAEVPPPPNEAESSFFSANGVFQLAKNANALPGEDMTLIVGVKHQGKGTVFLLTNEKDYGLDGLKVIEQSTYNNEEIMPPVDLKQLHPLFAGLTNSITTYSGSPDYGIKEKEQFKNSEQAIRYFSELYQSYKNISHYKVHEVGTERQFSFVHLQVSPEMWVDTNAIITITGVFIPDGGTEALIHKLEVPIVASHDPNKMSLKKARISYRSLARKKELIYKVQFQNDGEGDAKNIRLVMSLPKQTDFSSFKLLSLYPQCDSCQSEQDKGCWRLYPKGEDSLVFHFKDISLPGSAAEDISNIDSTQGFIRFSIVSKKQPNKVPFPSRTNIYFDKNAPVTTNRVTGRYRWGLSPILFLGYDGLIPGLGKASYWQGHERGVLGVGLSPLATFKRPYLQFELYGTWTDFEGNQVVNPNGGNINVADPNFGRDSFEVEYSSMEEHYKAKETYLQVVPLHLRYNFNSWMAAGVGSMVRIRMTSNSHTRRIYHLENRPTPLLPSEYEQVLNGWKNGPGSEVSFYPFADITIGRSYLGPAFGLRYYWGTQHSQYLSVYLSWRI